MAMAIVALPSPLILNKDPAMRVPTLDTRTLSREIAFVAPYRYVENEPAEETRGHDLPSDERSFFAP